MKIYFVRHGESEANVLNEFSNRGLKHGLTKKGKTQTVTLAQKLINFKIDYIYSSPLLRAQQTAKILSDKLKIPVKVVDELREHDCGLEGKSDKASWNRYAKLMDNWMLHNNYSDSIETGESYTDLKDRFIPFINKILTLNQNVVMVGHGALYRLMFPEIFNNIDKDFTYKNHLSNCNCVISKTTDNKLYCINWCARKIY